MPITVKIMPIPPVNPRVAVVAYDGLCTFEFGIAVEVFGLPRPEMGAGWYSFAVASADPGPLRATGGVRLVADGGLEALDGAGTVIVPGWRGADTPVPADLAAALRRAHGAGARLVSICSGVFVLAATGLLDGRRATTHWRYAGRLADAYPAIRFAPDVLYVDEGDVLTSAGSAAGIDLCLHIVRADHGPAVANRVARRLVAPAHREGGQAQYVERPVPPEREGARLGPLLDQMRGALDRGWSVDAMAAAAGMSRRTFLRRFHETTGQAPGDWLTAERLVRARDLLETTGLSVEDITTACGFGSADTLRHHFRTRLGTTPARYRRRFGA